MLMWYIGKNITGKSTTKKCWDIRHNLFKKRVAYIFCNKLKVIKKTLSKSSCHFHLIYLKIIPSPKIQLKLTRSCYKTCFLCSQRRTNIITIQISSGEWNKRSFLYKFLGKRKSTLPIQQNCLNDSSLRTKRKKKEKASFPYRNLIFLICYSGRVPHVEFLDFANSLNAS